MGEAGIVAQWEKLLIVMSVCHAGMLVQVPATPHPTQLFAYVYGKVSEDGPSSQPLKLWEL